MLEGFTVQKTEECITLEFEINPWIDIATQVATATQAGLDIQMMNGNMNTVVRLGEDVTILLRGSNGRDGELDKIGDILQ